MNASNRSKLFRPVWAIAVPALTAVAMWLVVSQMGIPGFAQAPADHGKGAATPKVAPPAPHVDPKTPAPAGDDLSSDPKPVDASVPNIDTLPDLPPAKDDTLNDDSPIFTSRDASLPNGASKSDGAGGFDVRTLGPGPKVSGTGGIGIGIGTGNGFGGRGGQGFGGRGTGMRTTMLGRYGGTKETERAVAAALYWLSKHQMKDGSWSLQKFSTQCTDKTCTGPGSVESLSGATAMGLLPFFAAGQTQANKGPFQQTIQSGIYWLISHQKLDGDLSADSNGHQAWMYSHALATIALCEDYGMSRDRTVGRAAQQAINIIQAAQNTKTGGWRYQPGQEGDTSVVGWQLMALNSAQMAGLTVNPATLDGAKKWLHSCGKRGDDIGKFSYQPEGGATPPISAIGILCNQHLHVAKTDPVIVGGVKYLMANQPDERNRNIYYWYYATQVIHNMGGDDWNTWNRKMRKILVDTQAREGCASGSWDPAKPDRDAWGPYGGRLMTTSLSCLTLEVYYRYLPLYSSVSDKKPSGDSPKKDKIGAATPDNAPADVLPHASPTDGAAKQLGPSGALGTGDAVFDPFGGVTAPSSGRSPGSRKEELSRSGGTRATDRAVAAALYWLAKHQSKDGSWSLQKFSAQCTDKTCTGPGSVESLSGATALALLPFLAADQTQLKKGPFQQTIQKGIYWLISHQKLDGDLSADAAPSAKMYSHGLATMALCEDFAKTHDKTVGVAAEKAVEFIEAAQNAKTGGWRYQPGEEGDTSMLGCQMSALKSAELAGLTVKPATLDGAKKWLQSCGKTGDNVGTFSYQPDGSATPTMSAIGILCNQYLHVDKTDPVITGGVKFLMANQPDGTKHNIYYWYYATQVLHNMAGKDWDIWNRKMRKILVESQTRSGCATGSWDPEKPNRDAWGGQGGRLMTTSLSCLTLELYYHGYMPLYPSKGRN